ncbi:MAG: GmrSD restriction endonuclease domain-containing protein [Chloroflexia bacterium]
MAIEQLKVREIVKRAVSKDVDIPEFQREFVWDPEQVKLLAESLYRDYPIGSFLLWDSSAYQEAKTAKGSQASLWIVDGQQRTTALCLLLGQKPYWWPDTQDWNEALKRYDVLVNLMPDEGDDRLEFALPNPIRRRDPRWASVRQILSLENVESLTPLAQETAKRLAAQPDEVLKVFGQIHARMQRLWQIRERDIPIIKISHEVADVAEIFARLNQAGTRVKEADVVLALAAVRNPGWVREDYLPFRNDLEERGWDLDAGIFIRTMTGIGHGRARLIEVPKGFWNPENLHGVWKKTRDGIVDVLKRLAEFGITSDELLPSTNSLIPLFVLHHRWRQSSDYAFSRALRWFLLANRDGRYSDSPITALNEDVRAIAEAPCFEVALENLEKRLRVSPEIAEDEFLARYDRAGSRFLRLVLWLLLFRRNASDWVDGARLGYDKTGGPITAGFQPQWHHVYPRSVLRKAGRRDDDIHALANITVLNEQTNVKRLAGKEPWRYIREHKISQESLEAHLIPARFAEAVETGRPEEQWAVQNYDGFLRERAQLLAREANKFLEDLKEG